MTIPKLYVAAWRERRGMNQTELAARIGVRQATVSDLETGRTTMIRLSLLGKLAAALRCEPYELLKGPPR